MNVLVLGGTRFIGRHIAEELLARGERVSVLNRGKSTDELPAAVERLRADRNDADAVTSAVAGRSWDACVDVCGYTPRQVRPIAEALRGRIGRYIFISTGSVYGEPKQRPMTEDHPLLEPAGDEVTEVTGETYGALKVACERIVGRVYGERCTLLRPQIVVGPHDPTERYSYWVRRAALGGEMLMPGDGSDHLQVVDVSDIARFTSAVIRHDLGGVFNMAGPRVEWGTFAEMLGVQRPVWVPAEVIDAAGVTELQLFVPERHAYAGLMDMSSVRAQHAGMTLTEPTATLASVRAWLEDHPAELALTPQREREVIHAARERPPG